MLIPIDKIVLGDRHRKQFERIAELANSIEEFGLIEPVVVDSLLDGCYKLIAGERRMKACQLLNWTEIDAVLKSNLDEWHRRAMELEENIQREKLTDSEEVEAKLQVHELYQQRHGIATPSKLSTGWGVRDTAELLGESRGQVAMDIELARAVREQPELKEKIDKVGKTAAYKALKASEELGVRKIVAQILAEDVADKEERVKVVLGDSREVLKKYPDESFDFCVTDPPYGVGIDESHDLGKTWDVRIGDVRGDLSLQHEVFSEVYRVLKEGAHCYVFFASMLFSETRRMLEDCGFMVSPIPLIWVKTRAANYDPYHRYSSEYEPIFYCSKGSSRTLQSPGVGDVFRFPTVTNKVHPTEKPLDLIKFLIENCSVEDEIGLDPFLGSGTFTLACQQTGRRAVGVEVDEGYYIEALKKKEE